MTTHERFLLAEVLFQIHMSLYNQNVFAMHQSEKHKQACLESIKNFDKSLEDFVKGE